MAAPCRTIISQFDPDNLDSMKGDCLVDPTYRHHTYWTEREARVCLHMYMIGASISRCSTE